MNYTILHLKCYIESFYIKPKNKIRILLQFFVKNLKSVSFPSSIMKKIAACWATFPVTLICCIAFGSASNTYCLLKSIAIIL